MKHDEVYLDFLRFYSLSHIDREVVHRVRSSVELGLARSWLTRALLHRGMCLRTAERSKRHEETVILSNRVFVRCNKCFLSVSIIPSIIGD